MAEIVQLPVLYVPTDKPFVAEGDYKKLWTRSERADARKRPATADHITEVLNGLNALHGDVLAEGEVMDLETHGGRLITARGTNMGAIISPVLKLPVHERCGFLGSYLMNGKITDSISLVSNPEIDFHTAVVSRHLHQRSSARYAEHEQYKGQLTASQEYMTDVIDVVAESSVVRI